MCPMLHQRENNNIKVMKKYFFIRQSMILDIYNKTKSVYDFTLLCCYDDIQIDKENYIFFKNG